MPTDHLVQIWKVAFENEKTHTNKSITEPAITFINLFNPLFNNNKICSIIINSFLDYITTEKKISFETLTNSFNNTHISTIKNFLLYYDYSITKNDEQLFLYAQTILSKQEQIIFQANNSNNTDFENLLNSHKIQKQSATTFDNAFDVVITMLGNKTNTFQKINLYIEDNLLIWNMEIGSLKNNWLLQNYNDRILKKLDNLLCTNLLDETNNNEDKKFLQLSGATLDGFHKNREFFNTVTIWFLKHLDDEGWNKFTKNWENEEQLKRGKKACEFITNSQFSHTKKTPHVIGNYVNMLDSLITDDIPPDRAFWWTKVFLNDAIYYVCSLENKKNMLIKQQDAINILYGATNSHLDFIEWAMQNKIMTTDSYSKLKPILEKKNLENQINSTYKIHKNRKI